VLVSEVMLQQTQAARVVTAYRDFIRRFPTVRALAAAERGDVLRAWNGLGYNRRAVALSEAARTVVREFGGRIPHDPEALLRLPGVGCYTAAAVASIAYGHRVPALDTNAIRVVGRVALGADPGEVSAHAVRVAAEGLLDRGDPGRWNQAVMDFGRGVCRPVPRCDDCPLSGSCRYARQGRNGSPPSRRQGPFPGSFRQVRGAVVRALTAHPWLTLAGLADETSQPIERVTSAVEALASEGLVRASRAALAGNAGGRVWLGERRSP
jgi:A/G-specific adenine glycosylase